jgi:hypothetical protein
LASNRHPRPNACRLNASYQATLLFEFSVVKIRPSTTGGGGGAQAGGASARAQDGLEEDEDVEVEDEEETQ